jgi:hypothetical protein
VRPAIDVSVVHEFVFIDTAPSAIGLVRSEIVGRGDGSIGADGVCSS